MILVTGAAGKTGEAVMRALCRRGLPVRVLVHREEQMAGAQALGAQEVVSGDLRSAAQLATLVRGCEAIYLICPNVSPDELTMAQNAIHAARENGVARFVYHSVFHPAIEAMPHHWCKMQVEAELFRSGLAYTILQPAPYMQNLRGYRADIMARHRYEIPYDVDARLSHVDLKDVAEVAARVLTEAGHEGATYELSGSDWLSQREIAALLSRQLGASIGVTPLPVDAWIERARRDGLGDYQIETLASMFRYYAAFGYRGNSRVLATLLGRRPASFREYLERDWHARQ